MTSTSTPRKFLAGARAVVVLAAMVAALAACADDIDAPDYLDDTTSVVDQAGDEFDECDENEADEHEADENENERDENENERDEEEGDEEEGDEEEGDEEEGDEPE